MTPIVMPQWRDKSAEPADGVRGNQPRQHKHLLDAANLQLQIQRAMLAEKKARDQAAEDAAIRRATLRTARLWFWGAVAVVGLAAWAYGILA